jgi:hypothetical protein
LSVTVPVEGAPPTTLLGLRLTAEGLMGRTDRLALAVTPACVAVIVTVVLAVTVAVLTTKVAVVAPAAMVTEAGTVATAALLVVRVAVVAVVTDALSRKVAVEVFPPPTVVGLRDSVVLRIDSLAVRVVPT